MNKFKFFKNSAGLTLIELIVALSIFAIIVPLATGLLVSIVQHQRKLLTQQDLLNQANYLSEYMSRALRTAIKSSGNICLSETDENYELIGGESPNLFGGPGSGIIFINHTDDDACQQFYLEEGKLKEKKNNVINNLTPGNYSVESFEVFVSPAIVTAENYQPRVTFSIVLKDNTEEENAPEARIQTTVSQRNLNLR